MFDKSVGNFQYSVRPCQHWGGCKSENGKHETVKKWHWKTRDAKCRTGKCANVHYRMPKSTYLSARGTCV